MAQQIGEAPSSTSVITGDDIRRFGYRSLADILRSVRGAYITDDRNDSYVGTRGSGRPGDFNTRSTTTWPPTHCICSARP